MGVQVRKPVKYRVAIDTFSQSMLNFYTAKGGNLLILMKFVRKLK